MVISAIFAVVFVLFIGSLYPSTSGIISNSTLATGATACKNCDAGIKTIGQNLPLMFVTVLAVSIILVVVIVAKKL